MYMASLFNLPSSRSSKSKDKQLLNKTTQVQTPKLVIKGGGTLATKIASSLAMTAIGVKLLASDAETNKVYL